MNVPILPVNGSIGFVDIAHIQYNNIKHLVEIGLRGCVLVI